MKARAFQIHRTTTWPRCWTTPPPPSPCNCWARRRATPSWPPGNRSPRPQGCAARNRPRRASPQVRRPHRPRHAADPARRLGASAQSRQRLDERSRPGPAHRRTHRHRFRLCLIRSSPPGTATCVPTVAKASATWCWSSTPWNARSTWPTPSPRTNRTCTCIGFPGCYDNAYAIRLMLALARHPNVGAVLAVGSGLRIHAAGEDRRGRARLRAGRPSGSSSSRAGERAARLRAARRSFARLRAHIAAEDPARADGAGRPDGGLRMRRFGRHVRSGGQSRRRRVFRSAGGRRRDGRCSRRPSR